jgi:hypothetical protein
VEDKAEAGPGFEQKRWEEQHLNAALLKFGARDAKTKSSVSVLPHFGTGTNVHLCIFLIMHVVLLFMRMEMFLIIWGLQTFCNKNRGISRVPYCMPAV